jgi:hypothetical protein
VDHLPNLQQVTLNTSGKTWETTRNLRCFINVHGDHHLPIQIAIFDHFGFWGIPPSIFWEKLMWRQAAPRYQSGQPRFSGTVEGHDCVLRGFSDLGLFIADL